MDVHKESYNLCCYLPNNGDFIGETKVDAKPILIKQYLEANKMMLVEEKGIEDVEFITAYEANRKMNNMARSMWNLDSLYFVM